MIYKIKKLLILSFIYITWWSSFVYSARSDSFIVVTKPKDIWHPSQITDLFVEPTEKEGELRFSWTAPTENFGLPTLSKVQGYYIRYANFSIDSLGGDTTLWWNLAQQIEINYANLPGQKEFFVSPPIFYPGTTYYFAIKSYDDAEPLNLVSLIDKKAQTQNQQVRGCSIDLAPAQVKNLTCLYSYTNNQIDVLLTWSELSSQEKGLNFRYYCIYRDTTSPEGPWSDYKLVGVSLTNTFSDVIDVNVNKAGVFYYRVVAKDKPPLELESIPSQPTMVVWDLQAPSKPTNVVAVGSDKKVILSWDINTEPDFLGYRIYRSTYSLGYTSPIKFINYPNYQDLDVENGITYYYVISAVDLYGNESEYSQEVVVMPKDDLPPSAPAGIKGILSRDAKTMTIQWSKVTKNEDGSLCNDLLGYNIYRASSINGLYEIVGFVSANSDLIWQDPQNVLGQVFYYYIRAVDTSQNLSKISMIVDSSLDMNIIAVDEKEFLTNFFIPKNLRNVLYKETNHYNDDVKIEVIVENKNFENDIIKTVQLVAKKYTTGEIIKDFVLKEPCLMNISYGSELNGYVIHDNLKFQNNIIDNKLSLFWFNGIEWLKIGGNIDSYFKIISIYTKHLGKYKLKNVYKETISFEIEAIQPDKIFTPNNDGWNDYFEIKYANPKGGIVFGKIYDIKGNYIADMKKGSFENSLVWDGRDYKGEFVSSGVYIYQIEITANEKKVINGTCILAR